MLLLSNEYCVICYCSVANTEQYKILHLSAQSAHSAVGKVGALFMPKMKFCAHNWSTSNDNGETNDKNIQILWLWVPTVNNKFCKESFFLCWPVAKLLYFMELFESSVGSHHQVWLMQWAPHEQLYNICSRYLSDHFPV